MLFVKILFLLLFNGLLSDNLWHIYVDLNLHEVIDTEQHNSNLLSALKQSSHADICFPDISKGMRAVSRINSPCGVLESFVPATYEALPDHMWIITCPRVLWIELTVITLDVPLSGPQCMDGYVAFLNLIGEPPDVKYCGRRPQEVLYASSKLTIVQHIMLLRSELRQTLEYQFISKQSYKINYRLPYILNTDCTLYDYACDVDLWRSPAFQLPDIHYHWVMNTGIMRYHILCMPKSITNQALRVILHASQCHYAVYNGPGVNSPVMANSSTHGPDYSMEITHLTYIQFQGSDVSCHNVSIEYQENYDQFLYSNNMLDGTDEAITCSNAMYTLEEGDHEFHVHSSDEHNAWCSLSFKSTFTSWTFALDMEFHGPNNYLQAAGNDSCQFGGVYLKHQVRPEYSHSFCGSLSLQPYTLRTTKRHNINIIFYTGYSSGKVRLTIVKATILPSMLNWNQRECHSSGCERNQVHIWERNYIIFDKDGSIKEDTGYIIYDTYPFWHPYFIGQSLKANNLHAHITAGRSDGTKMLGLVHFTVSLECLGNSKCTTEFIIRTGIHQLNMTSQVNQYNGSTDMDKHVVYARFISMSMNASHVDAVKLRVVFEKTQHCDYSSLSQYPRQLQYKDCDFIQLKYTLGHANFLTQANQNLVIELNPACPQKECINLNVRLTPTCYCSELHSYEWKHTALQYVPVKVFSSGNAAVSLSWTQSSQCSAHDELFQRLCDIWFQVETPKLHYDERFRTLVNRVDFLSVRVLPHIEQLYFPKV